MKRRTREAHGAKDWDSTGSGVSGTPSKKKKKKNQKTLQGQEKGSVALGRHIAGRNRTHHQAAEVRELLPKEKRKKKKWVTEEHTEGH